MIQFTASLYRVGAQRCVTVPESVGRACGAGRTVPVVVEIGQQRYESTLLPAKDGRFRLVVPASVLGAMGNGGPTTVTIDLSPDLQRAALLPPPDFLAALQAADSGPEAFQAQDSAMQRQEIDYIEGARSATIRAQRIQRTLEAIGAFAESRLKRA
jgi:hypothetical protein